MKLFMRKLFLAAAVILTYSALCHAQVTSDSLTERSHIRPSTGKMKYRDGEIIVKFKSRVTEKRKNSFHSKNGMKKMKEFSSLRMQHLKLPEGLTVDTAVNLLRNDPDVEYAEPNYKYTPQTIPNDPIYSQLWGMTKINASAAWDKTTGNSDVVVAVIDSGVAYNHPDLVANMWINPGEIAGNGLDDDGNGYVDDIHGIDTYNNDSDPIDDHYHGTHVAGTIGATGNNSIGVAGVNWNVKIIACKFIGADGYGDTAGAVSCLQYLKNLKQRGINIVATNNSWGGDDYSQALHDAIKDQKDILFIAAAGNDLSNNDFRPAYPCGYNLPNIIAVSATDQDDNLAYFSNYGRRTVHVAAPGVGIASTIPDGYASLSGTSMAAPHVTGIAALLSAQDVNRDWKAIRNLILASGDPVNSATETTITGKRVNANSALTCANRPLFSILQAPYSLEPGVPATLSILSINCGVASGPVTVSASGGEPITLADDGLAPDQVAGDGIFTGVWTPVATVETLSISSPAGGEIIAIPSLAITTSSLPEGNIGIFYQVQLQASGGVTPYLWDIQGSLPPGLTFDTRTGIISGAPTTPGSYWLTFGVSDAYGATSNKMLGVTVEDGPLLESWIRSYDTSLSDVPDAIAVDGSGNVCITGRSNDPYYLGVNYPLTVKYSTEGNLLWYRNDSRGLPAQAHDELTAIAADAEGNTYVTGYTEASVRRLLTIKYGPSGTLLWHRTYDCDAGLGCTGMGVTVDSGGNVYATATRILPDDGRGIVTVKYDSAGNFAWSRNFGESDDHYARGIAVDSGGNVYVTGDETVYAGQPIIYSNVVTIKYDPSGNLAWSRRYAEQGVSYWSLGAGVDATGNIYVACNLSGGSRTLKYDSAGNILWNSMVPFPSTTFRRMAVDRDGNSYVTGNLYPNNTLFMITTKLDPLGNLVWAKTKAGNYSEGVAADGNGNIYVAGESPGSIGGFGYLTIKYAQLPMSTLSLSREGNGTGAVQFIPEGSCSGSCTKYFKTGSTVTLSPAPDIDSVFTGWSGACTGSGTCVIYLDAPQNVTATFAKKPVLSYSRLGTGSGTVSFSSGSSCAGSCILYPDASAQITISADPATDSVFAGWGGACSGTGECVVTMDGNREISAIFNNPTPPVTTASPPGGAYTGTQTVTLAVNRASTIYYTLDGSTPTTSSAVYDTPIPILSSTVLKYFARDTAGYVEEVKTETYTIDPQYLLTINMTGSGSGRVYHTQGNCSANCSLVYQAGTMVTLASAPVGNSVFTGWSGACSGTGECIVAVNGNTFVTATFSDTTLPTTTIAPSGGTYNSYQTITLVSDEAATIYYTLDGSLPTTASSVYRQPIHIYSPTMIRFFARDAAGNSEAVQTATYDILYPPAVYSVTASVAGGSGAISPSTTMVPAGAGQTIIITPSAGSFLSNLTDNGAPAFAAPSATGEYIYTMKNVTGPHVIAATFASGPPPQSGVMTRTRYGHSATLLPNGTVLLIGGGSYKTTEIYDPSTGLFTPATSLSLSRSGHSATLLKNGKVLIVGGNTGTADTNTAELYDPATGLFTPTGNLATGRSYHSAILLNDGRVLVAGGSQSSAKLKSAEIYNPDLGTFTPTGSMNVARAYFSATLLRDGTVLMAGGEATSGTAPMEIYNAGTGTFATSIFMPYVAGNFSANLLDNDKVLFAGGRSPANLAELNTAQWFDPNTGSTGATGNMLNARAYQTATPLANGKVLIAGGSKLTGDFELFDWESGLFSTAGSMATIRRYSHKATLLPNGNVLITGGVNKDGYESNAVDLFDAMPPVLSITSPVPGIIKENAPLLAFTSNKPNVTITLDGVPVAKASGEYLNTLLDGPHTLRVTSASSTASASAEVTFFVDTSPPAAIVSGVPVTPTGSTGATLSIGGADIVVYRYKLDSGVYSDEIPVATPISLTLLSEGPHTVSVVGRDYAGNWQVTATTVNWTVDLTPPTAIIMNAPPINTNSTGAILTVNGIDVAAYRHKLDNGDYSGETPVSVPIVISSLSEGPHSVFVLARDSAGNWQATPTMVNWSVDTTPPTVIVMSAPPATTNSTSATIAIGGVDLFAYKYSLDNGDYSGERPAATPITLNSLGEGAHTVSVLGRDNAGNWQMTAGTVNWTVDITPPDTSLDGKPESETFAVSGGFTFSSPDTSALFECSLDGAAWTGCVSSYSYSNLGIGTHTFSVRSKDAAGNSDPTPAVWSWTIAALPAGTIILDASGYMSISAAYAAITGVSSTMRLRDIEFNGDLLFDRDVTVTLKGGNDTSFTSRNGMTTIKGKVTIKSGMVVMDQIIVI